MIKNAPVASAKLAKLSRESTYVNYKICKPVVIYIFMIICIGVYFLDKKSGYMLSSWGMANADLIRAGETRRVLTCALLHSGIIHLVSNMIILRWAGSYAERYYGHKKTAILILGTALTAGLASITFNASNSVGASGVVFGIMLSLFPIRYVMDPTEMRVLNACKTLIIINAISGLLVANVDNFAHLGGAVAGYVLGKALAANGEVFRNRDKKVFSAIYLGINLILCVLFFCGPDLTIEYNGIGTLISWFIKLN